LTITEEQESKLTAELAKMEAKATAKANKLQSQKASSRVIIKRVERGKRKYVTVIANLQVFHVDLKKTAKSMAQKFARGASVTKNVEGKDEIVVQGDLVDEIEEFIVEQLGISEDQVVVREEKAAKK
jgi:density-regulated protein